MAVTSSAHTLLLLLLTICCDATQSQSLCESETCHISPDKFWQLKDIIRSNRLIVLNGMEFSVDDTYDFIVIENVSNLTLSGGENSSLIECSSNSSFGLHLKNATNVTLTRIRIRNCGFPVAHSVTSLYIETSTIILLSGVHIEYSQGFAMEVMDISTNEISEDPFFLMDNVNPNMVVIDCGISHSREGSIMITGRTSLLIERTVVASSDWGIQSDSANIIMKNVNVTNCTYSDLIQGRAMVKGRLTITNSTLYIESQDLYIHSSKSLFYDVWCYGVTSDIFVSDNSEVMFTRSQLELSETSSLQLRNGSILSLTENVNTAEYVVALLLIVGNWWIFFVYYQQFND